MQFTSAEYVFFFPVVAAVCFAVPGAWRWLILLVASSVFYFCAPNSPVISVLFVTIVGWGWGLLINGTHNPRRKRWFLGFGLAMVLGHLCMIKYAALIPRAASLVAYESTQRGPWDPSQPVLPLGVSFYTFLIAGYLIDVYRKQTPPEKHFGVWSLYVLFFPKLLAGPIERANNLLSQLRDAPGFDHARVSSGLKLIAWGCFKKLVVANKLGLYVDAVFNNPGEFHGLPVLIAFYLYAFQIYCDFSGYTDIAIGSARILGYELLPNFKRPYLADSIRDFWRRWHISLTSWFRDYLYIALGGNRVSQWRWYLNAMIVFILSGIWHGSGATFVFWGLLHGAYYVCWALVGRLTPRLAASPSSSSIHGFERWIRTFITFQLVVFAWIFFRSSSLGDALLLIQNAIQWTGELGQLAAIRPRIDFGVAILAAVVVIIAEICEELNKSQWATMSSFRWVLYYLLVISTILFGETGGKNLFIYGSF